VQLKLLSSDEATLALGGAVILGAIVWGMRSHYKNRPKPAELERRRRAMLNAHGKMGDCQISEIQGTSAIYSYHVRGVEYTASQDFDAPGLAVPEDPWSMVGAAGVKYDPRNPANSIIISDKWSGVRVHQKAEQR
jgi:hypothetical protein